VKDNQLSKLEFLQIKRNLEIKIIEMMKKQLHYDPYLLKNDLYLLNHERELEKIEAAINSEKTKIQTQANQDLQ
jgi:hypothetical protein